MVIAPQEQPATQQPHTMSSAGASHTRNRILQSVVEYPPMTPTLDEHPMMEWIRSRIHHFQQESPAHFELAIEANQIDDTQPRERQTKPNLFATIIRILIQGNSIRGRIAIPVICRITSRKRRSRTIPFKCTVVARDGSVETLHHFLSTNFHIIDAALKPDTMWNWWQITGKKFNWAALPTELKERVIEFCMHQPYTFGVYSERITRFERRYRNNRSIQFPGPYEIVEQLRDWYQLLYVSHQVRAITLRLCIVGGGDIAHSKGLTIFEFRSSSLLSRFDRLGDYYQMVGPQSVPTTSKEEALSKCYSYFPRIYPELRQYATLLQGIQKICLCMDFLSFMNFFHVKAGDFERFQDPRAPTYHVLDRLPNLNEIVISLPLRPRRGWKNTPEFSSPRLFHHDSPCPRILHRVIYERAAEVLALHARLTVRNFIDRNEQQRFLSARLEAIKALKLSNSDIEELYADSDGGVELPEEMKREVRLPERISRKNVEMAYPGMSQSSFFPPLCQCDTPCTLSLGSEP